MREKVGTMNPVRIAPGNPQPCQGHGGPDHQGERIEIMQSKHSTVYRVRSPPSERL